MAHEIEPLVSTSELKTTLLKSLAEDKATLFVSYDKPFDALIILFVPPENKRVVHYIDDHVALVYEPESLEIVGLQIEDFEYSFLPRHESVRRVWRLSETGVTLHDFGEIIVAVEGMKPRIAREVVRAADHIPDEVSRELEAAIP